MLADSTNSIQGSKKIIGKKGHVTEEEELEINIIKK
jgi:hypothetical protein